VKLKFDGKYFRYEKHVEIEPGRTYDTDSSLCYRDDRMPDRLKSYIEKNNPGVKSLKIS